MVKLLPPFHLNLNKINEGQNNPIDYTVYGGVGFEYSWQNMAFIRGGTRLYHDTAGLSLGGGLKWNMFAVDYAYVNYGILEETHQFGINLSF